MKQTKVTFWQLLQEYSIEIPTIQRDYTYGRDGAKTIGNKLVESIFNSLINGLPLQIDFIYGKLEGKQNYVMLEKNKQSIESLLSSIKTYAKGLHLQVDFKAEKQSNESSDIITFIPLDGQQRLTTLFLIHWYLSTMSGEKELSNRFSNFTYSTRQSSKRFLEFLCSSSLTDSLQSKESIVETIENHELFFPFWKKDPTVNSVLYILETIERLCKTKAVDFSGAWTRLTEESLVYFDFFDLDDFELTDELYVKMNARGKALTDFENFKAWLIKSLKATINMPDWEKKMDISWNDLFWKERLKNQTKIDTEYLQFFMNMYLSDYLLGTFSPNDSAQKINSDNKLELIRKTENTVKSMILPSDILDETEIFRDHVEEYFMLLESLATKDLTIELNENFVETSSLKKFLLRPKNLTWWDHTYQYALRQYIIKFQDRLDELQTWARILGNLIYNSPIETASLHRDACEGINKILEEIADNDILTGVGLLSDSGYGLAEKQLNEEKQKARIILSHPETNWSEKFFELEKHKYFYGQIGFIIDMAGGPDFENFEIIAKNVSALFSEEVLSDSTYLLFRACLAIPSYNPEITHRFSFPSNVRGTFRNRNENWRRFIQYNLDILKEIIDNQYFKEENILNSLEEIIQNAHYKSEMIKLLAVDPKNLQYAKQNQIRFFEHTCLLLNSSKISGLAVELFTYHWCNNQELLSEKSPSEISYNYSPGRGENDIPGLIVGIGEDEFKIICNRYSGGFSIFSRNGEFSSDLKSLIFQSIDESIEYLIQKK